MSSIISSQEVQIGVCKALGLDPDRVRRIVLDLDATRLEPLTAYVEMYGDERFLNIKWELDEGGVKLEFADKEK